VLPVGLRTAKGQPALMGVRSRAKCEMPTWSGGKEGGGLLSLPSQAASCGNTDRQVRSSEGKNENAVFC